MSASGAKRPFARKQHATTSELVDLYAVGGDGGCGQQERQSSENPKSCLLVIGFVSDARKGTRLSYREKPVPEGFSSASEWTGGAHRAPATPFANRGCRG